MCWPSQPQISPPSRRITVAERSTASVLAAASIMALGYDEAKIESLNAKVSRSSASHRAKASRPVAAESAHCVA